MLKKDYTIDMLNEKCEQDLSKEIMSNYSALIKTKKLVNVMFFSCMILILFVVFKYPAFLLVMCVLAALKYMIDNLSVIHLTYNLSSDCEAIIKARLFLLEKVKKAPSFFMYLADTKFPCEILNSAPWPFKIETYLICIKSSNTYLLFLPDKLYHIMGSDITAYDYNDIVISEGHRTITEMAPLPPEVNVVGRTYLHPRKNGDRDMRYKNNPAMYLCLYDEILIKSSNENLSESFIMPHIPDRAARKEEIDRNNAVNTSPVISHNTSKLSPYDPFDEDEDEESAIDINNTSDAGPTVKVNSEPKKREIRKIIPPVREGSHPLQYEYIMNFCPVNSVDVANDILGTSEKIVNIKATDNKIELIYNGVIFGFIENPQKAEMLCDWEEKGFPAHAILLSDAQNVNLRFYRDKRIGNEWREQSIIKLTSYRGKEKQLINSWLFEGIQLDLFEDDYHEGIINVCYHGTPIGNLPAKAARRYLDEGAYLVTVESVEEKEIETANFDIDYVYIPSIRIFWNKRS